MFVFCAGSASWQSLWITGGGAARRGWAAADVTDATFGCHGESDAGAPGVRRLRHCFGFHAGRQDPKPRRSSAASSVPTVLSGPSAVVQGHRGQNRPGERHLVDPCDEENSSACHPPGPARRRTGFPLAGCRPHRHHRRRRATRPTPPQARHASWLAKPGRARVARAIGTARGWQRCVQLGTSNTGTYRACRRQCRHPSCRP